MFEYDDDSIIARNGYMVMHRWETPIMKMMAIGMGRGNTGDILEVGYGMGICQFHTTASSSHPYNRREGP